MSCFVSLDRYASMCRWSIGLLAADEARLYVRVFVCLFCCLCVWGGVECIGIWEWVCLAICLDVYLFFFMFSFRVGGYFLCWYVCLVVYIA